MIHKEGCKFPSEGGSVCPPLESEQADCFDSSEAVPGRSEAVPGLWECWEFLLWYCGAQSHHVKSLIALIEGPLGGTLRLHGDGEGS